jgi:hypothetical protein
MIPDVEIRIRRITVAVALRLAILSPVLITIHRFLAPG